MFPELAAEPAAATLTSGRSSRLTLQVMDLHTAGEPLRLVRSGFPDVPMLPVLERRQWVKDNVDNVRQALMYEPRGHSRHVRRDPAAAVQRLRRHDRAVHAQRGLQHDVRPRHHRDHDRPDRGRPLPRDGAGDHDSLRGPGRDRRRERRDREADDGTWAVRGVRFTNVPSYLAAQSLSVRPDGVAAPRRGRAVRRAGRRHRLRRRLLRHRQRRRAGAARRARAGRRSCAARARR